jgi:hypothetical protein
VAAGYLLTASAPRTRSSSRNRKAALRVANHSTRAGSTRSKDRFGGAGQAEVVRQSRNEKHGGEDDEDADQQGRSPVAAVVKLFAANDTINLATFTTGTVLKVADSASSATGGMGTPPPGASGGSSGNLDAIAEHLASFEPAYKITALRDRLFEQNA